MGEEREALEQSERLEALRLEASGLPDVLAQRDEVAQLRLAHKEARSELAQARAALAEAADVHGQSAEANALQRRWRGLPKPDEQMLVLEAQRRVVSEREAIAAAADRKASAAAEVLARAQALADDLAPWQAVPRLGEQRSRFEQARTADQAAHREAAKERHVLATAGSRVKALEDALATLTEHHGAAAESVIRAATEHREQLIATEQELSARSRLDASNRDRLSSQLWEWLKALTGLDLDVATDRRGAEEMLAELRRARDVVAARVVGLEVVVLRSETDESNAEIRRANAELAQIEEQMKTVEATVIAEARVIATTLTRAYTREPVHARAYDTVILDEASMAPIPALWAAGALAERNVASSATSSSCHPSGTRTTNSPRSGLDVTSSRLRVCVRPTRPAPRRRTSCSSTSSSGCTPRSARSRTSSSTTRPARRQEH